MTSIIVDGFIVVTPSNLWHWIGLNQTFEQQTLAIILLTNCRFLQKRWCKTIDLSFMWASAREREKIKKLAQSFTLSISKHAPTTTATKITEKKKKNRKMRRQNLEVMTRSILCVSSFVRGGDGGWGVSDIKKFNNSHKVSRDYLSSGSGCSGISKKHFFFGGANWLEDKNKIK